MDLCTVETEKPYGHVDIYFESHEDAMEFGRMYADVYQVN